MSDYAPRFASNRARTFTASAAITQGQLVAISGNEQVAPTSGATAAWIGVAAQTVLSGQTVTVFAGGTQILTATGAVAAGDNVIAAAGGTVATIGSDTTYDHVVGVATSAAASGASVYVSMTR